MILRPHSVEVALLQVPKGAVSKVAAKGNPFVKMGLAAKGIVKPTERTRCCCQKAPNSMASELKASLSTGHC